MPILAKVRTRKVELDWEASESGWFTPEEVKSIEMPAGAQLAAAEFFPILGDS